MERGPCFKRHKSSKPLHHSELITLKRIGEEGGQLPLSPSMEMRTGVLFSSELLYSDLHSPLCSPWLEPQAGTQRFDVPCLALRPASSPQYHQGQGWEPTRGTSDPLEGPCS